MHTCVLITCLVVVIQHATVENDTVTGDLAATHGHFLYFLS